MHLMHRTDASNLNEITPVPVTVGCLEMYYVLIRHVIAEPRATTPAKVINLLKKNMSNGQANDPTLRLIGCFNVAILSVLVPS